MSFPNFRAHLDVLADDLFKEQIAKTPTSEAITLDDSPLHDPAQELIARQNPADVAEALRKHMVEHSYKTARNIAKGRGKRILRKMGRGQWPLPLELNDAVYAVEKDLYPLRYMTSVAYADYLDSQHRQAKHELDRVENAVATKVDLLTVWGNRMLYEVVT